MDRRLQSGLEKRTRVGAWQSRVYRLERGYLSAWPDAVSVEAKQDPTRTECLFLDNQVAVLTDQGDKRFKLDFPWDGSKTLQLRSSNVAMKQAWVDLLRATLDEAGSQIRATGSVFAYGGAAQHAKDEAYEEATYLKTNRFLAAYVVNEQSRASYINDLLNDGFHHVGDGAGSERDAHSACAGSRSAIAELLALTEDFKKEMQGVEELRRGTQGSETSEGQLDGAVTAAKIERFCEEYMSLVGRTISSRLMLELSPFMETSVAGSSSAPAESTRAELVATRRRLDEAYAATEQVVILGTRAWFVDIREYFLDCAGLEVASSRPPTPPPEVATQTAAFSPPPAAPASAPIPLSAGAEAQSRTTPSAGSSRRPSAKALLQVSNAFSVAKAATKDGATKIGTSWNAKGRSTGKSKNSSDTDDAPVRGSSPADQAGAGGKVNSTRGVSMSIPGVFKRASRTGTEMEERSDLGKPADGSTPVTMSPRGSGGPTSVAESQAVQSSDAEVNVVMEGGGGKPVSPAETEEQQRSDLFGGSSRGPSTSPRVHGGKNSPVRRGKTESVFSTSSASTAVPPSASEHVRSALVNPSSTTTSASSLPSTTGSGARKEKRAFAGGLWGGGGGSSGGGASAGNMNTDARDGSTMVNTTVADEGQLQSVPAAISKSKPSGGKRRFAGGVFSGPPQPPSQLNAAPSDGVQSENPFAGASDATTMRRDGNGATHKSVFGANETVSSSIRREELPKPPREVEEPLPAWATGAGANESVPDWAANSSMDKPSKPPSGYGLAPPSRPEQGHPLAADKSPFVQREPDAPPARRPSQRRPGEAGSRRAFGGGERLF
ncbi:unnamed protein product [Ectocarpus sp. CCAP 1310/34]|nr:unnamed protein product [Ectocarpus sp. CCAP 1310/34]